MKPSLNTARESVSLEKAEPLPATCLAEPSLFLRAFCHLQLVPDAWGIKQAGIVKKSVLGRKK